ncbi:TerB family tellurite resistance protein [Acidovorax sp.]|uniref:TerB family tellurite resistance protein n=1 Tax=Acidovorax sp. TaxID=1872122 RepID=UPI00391F7642
MRSYPTNSPEAAARIVALLLIADGNVSRSEIDSVHGMRIESHLGLQAGDFVKVLHTLCEDLLADTREQKIFASSVDEATLKAVLAEITDPALQHSVLYFADLAVLADQHIAPAEAWAMGVALSAWTINAAHTESWQYQLV